MDVPAFTGEIRGVAAAVVSRVTHDVGIVVESALIDGGELMTLDPAVVWTLQLRIITNFCIADRLLHPCLVVGAAEGTVLLDLQQTVIGIEESPAQEVVATSPIPNPQSPIPMKI